MRHADGQAHIYLRFGAVGAILAMAPTLAFAYIDPGNGAYMVQALFALAGAALFYLRHPLRSLKMAWQWTTQRFRQPSQAATIGGGRAMNSDADGTDAASAGIPERTE